MNQGTFKRGSNGCLLLISYNDWVEWLSLISYNDRVNGCLLLVLTMIGLNGCLLLVSYNELHWGVTITPCPQLPLPRTLSQTFSWLVALLPLDLCQHVPILELHLTTPCVTPSGYFVPPYYMFPAVLSTTQQQLLCGCLLSVSLHYQNGGFKHKVLLSLYPRQ